MSINDTAGAVSRASESCALGTSTSAAERGLDWLNFFVANVQTGFGPFVAVYLTTRGWTQTAIGLALSLGTIAAMASQVPAGALVDAIPNKARVALFSVLAFSVSALLFAVWPVPLGVYVGEVLHGFSSCTLGPAIAAMSLAIAGPAMLGLRLGRNARFAAIGTAIGAALMGALGYYVSERAVFFLTAALAAPAIIALLPLAGVGEPPPSTRRGEAEPSGGRERVAHLLTNRALLTFALCAMLFTLANAAMLPLAGNALTKRASSAANLLIAACIVLPQFIVAAVSPAVGQLAIVRGRRLVLLLGFFMLPLRGILFALLTSPIAVVLIQALDGIAATCFGVMLPLVTADIAGRSGHFNLSLGFVGLAVGLGATASTSLAGWVADWFGTPAAFACLAGVGLAAVLLVWRAMPETKPETSAAR
jgi:MFS family permease